MNISMQRRRFFGLLVSFITVIGLLGSTQTGLAASGRPSGRIVQSSAQDAGPAAFGYGDIKIKTKTDTGAILKGACYEAWVDIYFYGRSCDFWDGTVDGYTYIENLSVGTFRVYMSYAPKGYFLPAARTGIRVTEGGVTSLVFSTFPGSSQVVVRAKTPAGDYVLGACYSIHEGTANGTQLLPYTCDWDDGKEDGKVILSGLYVPIGTTRKWVVVQRFTPGGYLPASNKTLTAEPGSTENAGFVNNLMDLSPTCTLASSSGLAGTAVAVSCKGFGSNQRLQVIWDGEVDLYGGYAYCDVQGRCSGVIYAPYRTGGVHSVVLRSPSHAAPAKSFTVKPAVFVYPPEGKGGTEIFLYLDGFKAGEQITVRRQGSATILAGPVTADASGSTRTHLFVPDGEAATLTFYAEGSGGSVGKATFKRTGPAPVKVKPTETATATVVATVTATATPEATATATVPPTEVPTIEPTAEVIETVQVLPTETPVSSIEETAIPVELTSPEAGQ